MSDNFRQSFTDKAGAALKVRSARVHGVAWHRLLTVASALQPDSEKSTTEHFGDMFKGKADSAASTMQPQVSS